MTTNNLFLFCIGGTGSRVLRALTFMMASGVKLKANRIIPIIMDPDVNNGDVARTLELIKQYQEVRNELRGATECTFFGTELQTLADLAPTAPGATQPVNALQKSFRYDISGTRAGQFQQFIGHSTMSPADKAFISAMFPNYCLESKLEVGFKGHPNMGSIVLNTFKDSPEYKQFANCFGENDRVFIISSIFGGTGAAGFPLLVKNLRNANAETPNSKLLRNAPIGALSMKPYFNVAKSNDSMINSDSFIGKTKSALGYYHKYLNKSVNALYYLADTHKTNHENREGGISQMNKAHFIELLAADAVLQFLDTPAVCANGVPVNPESYEYTLQKVESGKPLTLSNLSTVTKHRLARPMIQFAYSVSYLQKSLLADISKEVTFAKAEPKFDMGFAASPFYANNLSPFNNSFKTWLSEMGVSEKNFTPFDIELESKAMNALVVGVTQEKTYKFPNPITSNEWTHGYITEEMNGHSKNTASLSRPQKLMTLLCKTTNEIVDTRLKKTMGI